MDNPATADAEYKAFIGEVEELEKNDTKAGQEKYSRYRMAHAHTHGNVQPGEYGRPFMPHNITSRQLQFSLGVFGCDNHLKMPLYGRPECRDG